MKNADLPAMPISLTDSQLDFFLKSNKEINISGLTKREHFAAMAMQGAIAAHFDADDVPTYAVSMADALLAALEQSK